MNKLKTIAIRVICSVSLVIAIVGLAMPVAHATERPMPRAISAATAAARHLPKLPRHASFVGEGSATGLWQALVLEACIGAIGLVATIAVVNHRRHGRQHHQWPL